MIKKAIIFSAILYLMFSTGILKADEDTTLDKRQDYGKEDAPKGVPQKVLIKDRFKYDFYIGASEGYDNNVFLDSSRKGDMYDTTAFSADFKYKPAEPLTIRTEYGFNSMTYHNFTDFSFIDNNMAASLEYLHKDKIKIAAGYGLDFMYYFKNSDGTYNVQGPFANIRYFPTQKMFVGAGYEYKKYDYKERKIYSADDKRLEVTREDNRHNIIAELGAFVGKAFLKLKNVYGFNDSNDEYMDYYDYESERITGYITYPVFKKTELMLIGGYERKNFTSRQISISTAKEHDDLMTLGGSLYYNIVSSAYINLNYTYRQNYSNDPIQEYSGSMSTLGFHLFF